MSEESDESAEALPGGVEPLDATEARVLGVLVEKAFTTPDQYPLSLNALTVGSNQKSNRSPVLSLDERDVLEAVHRLRRKGLATLVQLSNSRVERFKQVAREKLGVDAPSLVTLAELLLRGPQMPGELRGRATRMVPIESLEALDQALEPLFQRGLAKRIAPARGSRAPRVVQLLAPGIHALDEDPGGWDASDREAGGAGRRATRSASAGGAGGPGAAALEARVAALEAEVATLREALQALDARVGA